MLGMLFLTDTMTITAQNLAVKTNVLYWTTATFNASVETRLSSKWILMFRRVTIRSHFLITKS